MLSKSQYQKPYKYIVVGAGPFGATFARAAADAGKSVLVLDKRSQLGGNCASYWDRGVELHMYGTHVFHTSSRRIWDFVNRFGEFNRYEHRVKASVNGRRFPVPICLDTINHYFGVSLSPDQVHEFLKVNGATGVVGAKSLEQKGISELGPELYGAFIRGYSRKQWGADPVDLPASLLSRIPLRTSHDDRYFTDPWQGIPIEGWGQWFQRLLDGIPVELDCDYLSSRDYWQARAVQRVVFTGPIDGYFGCELGRLRWRSVSHEFESLPTEDYQGAAVINFPGAEPYTRIHEFRHLHPEARNHHGFTIIAREYATSKVTDPAYPFQGEDDRALHRRYVELAASEKHVVFGGRLGSYAYFNIDQSIASALSLAERELQ